MANVNAYMGFVPVRHAHGGLVRASAYKIASAYGADLFTGDAVILTSGRVNIAAQDSAVILGIFAGCQFLDSSGVPGGRWSPYWPTGTVTTGSADAIAYVYDDPGIVYRVQASVGTAYVDTTHKGGSYDMIATHAGNAVTGISGQELNLGDTGSTQFQVLGLIDEVGNAAGTNAKLEVVIRKALLAQY